MRYCTCELVRPRCQDRKNTRRQSITDVGEKEKLKELAKGFSRNAGHIYVRYEPRVEGQRLRLGVVGRLREFSVTKTIAFHRGASDDAFQANLRAAVDQCVDCMGHLLASAEEG